MSRTRFKPLDLGKHHRDHWLCRLFGRHVRYTIIGQTCSEPEWTAQCEVCDRHGDFFIPTPADKQRFGDGPDANKRKGWFL
jgi:hypothetical protein